MNQHYLVVLCKLLHQQIEQASHILNINNETDHPTSEPLSSELSLQLNQSEKQPLDKYKETIVNLYSQNDNISKQLRIKNFQIEVQNNQIAILKR